LPPKTFDHQTKDEGTLENSDQQATEQNLHLIDSALPEPYGIWRKQIEGQEQLRSKKKTQIQPPDMHVFTKEKHQLQEHPEGSKMNLGVTKVLCACF
jgi:hypothetical protein